MQLWGQQHASLWSMNTAGNSGAQAKLMDMSEQLPDSFESYAELMTSSKSIQVGKKRMW